MELPSSSLIFVLKRKVVAGREQVVPLDRPATIFGRMEGKQLMQIAVRMKYVKSIDELEYVSLPHTEISRVHAKILVRDGVVTLCDLNETNGSAVVRKGTTELIQVKKSTATIEPGDTILFAPIARQQHNYVYRLDRLEPIGRENIPEWRTDGCGFRHQAVASAKDPGKRKRENSSLAKLFTSGSQSAPATEAVGILKDAEPERPSLSPKIAPHIKRLRPSSDDSFEKGNTSGQTIPSASTTFKTPEKCATTKIQQTPSPQKPQIPQKCQPTENISEEFGCVICMELLIPPCIVTDCGHNFCEYCIDTWMYRFRKQPHVKCPTCGEIIKNRIRQYAIANCVEKLESKMTASQRADRVECRSERTVQVAEFQTKRETDLAAEQNAEANKSSDTNIGVFAMLDIESEKSQLSTQGSTRSRRSSRRKCVTAPPVTTGRKVVTRKRDTRKKS